MKGPCVIYSDRHEKQMFMLWNTELNRISLLGTQYTHALVCVLKWCRNSHLSLADRTLSPRPCFWWLHAPEAIPQPETRHTHHVLDIYSVYAFTHLEPPSCEFVLFRHIYIISYRYFRTTQRNSLNVLLCFLNYGIRLSCVPYMLKLKSLAKHFLFLLQLIRSSFACFHLRYNN